jgi:drug/metabolite transporter (DMT)-like permease
MDEKSKNIFYMLLFFAMFGWGLSWVSVKVLSNYINEFEMVFFRFSMTTLTMIPIILYLKKSFRIDLKSLGLVTLTSVVMLGYMKYFFLGTKLGTASLGGAFVTTLIPIITFVFMVLLRKKTLRGKDVFALMLGTLGILTILNVWSTSLEQILIPQNLYFILAAFLWATLTILSSKNTKLSPIVFTFYMYIITSLMAVVFFVDFSAIRYEGFDGLFWLNIIGITLLSTTYANTIYFLGIEKLGASEVSSFVFLVPFFAIGLAALFLDEPIDSSVIVGTVLALIAVKMLNDIKLWESK